MAIGSPFHERSCSPPGALPEATPVERERRGFRHCAPTEGALDLGLVRAAIQDGLLMVFGPDDDPVPPQVFGAAAARQPHAGVPLADGPPVPAERIATVLHAQIRGRSEAGREGGEAWIRAMLGIGPQLEMAGNDDLLAEDCTVEVVAFGRELMITSPGGTTFLLADARAHTPIRLRMPGEGPVAISELVGELLASAGQDAARPGVDEFAAPECRAWLEGDALRIDLPGVGVVDLARVDDAASAAPSVSLFMASGEIATIDDLLSALGRPVALPSATVHADPLDLALPQFEAGGQRRRSVPLTIGLPDALAAEPDRVVLVLMRGLPEGASLSAGSKSGDGSWLLSPRDLPGLSITPPPAWACDLTLEVAAIAIASPEGELTSAAATISVPLQSAALEPAPAPLVDAVSAPMVEAAASLTVEPAPAPPGEPVEASIPLGLDPLALSDGGQFDAVIVRGLPAGVILSAGTYDPAIAGWVLLPYQLSELSVLVASGQTVELTLDLLGVNLRPGGGARPRVLARVPVSVD